jgi:hypothetical protein
MLLRNKFLNTTAFLLEKEVDSRTAAQIERDSIEVTNKNKEEKEEVEKEEEEIEEEEKEEEEKEEEKEVEETDEQKTARIAQEKEKRREDRIQKRIDKLTAEKETLKAEKEALAKQLSEKTVEGLSEEEVDRRAEAKAATKIAEQQEANNKKEFEKNCDLLEASAIKINKDFSNKVQEMVTEIGSPIPAIMINIMADLDNENGGAVLNYLANNIDETEELYGIDRSGKLYVLSERKMTQKLIRISDKLKEDTKKPKDKSNVPPPITPINEGSRDLLNRQLTGKEDQETFNRIRARQVEERRKQRGY